MVTEVSPRQVPSLEACGFYHTMDLPTHGHQEGHWDLRGRFDDYTAHVPVKGRTVLDVGAATGFLSFEAEKRGALVTSFDASSADQFHQLPIQGTDYVRDHAAWRAKQQAWLDRVKNSYWLCHADLGSRAGYIEGDVHNIARCGGVFDVVLVGQLLIHLRDAITALTAIASVCADTIVITEGSFDNDTPIAALSGRADRPEVAYAWYQYSYGWYLEVLTMLGFASVAITTGTYLCQHADHASEIELATIVATR